MPHQGDEFSSATAPILAEMRKIGASLLRLEGRFDGYEKERKLLVQRNDEILSRTNDILKDHETRLKVLETRQTQIITLVGVLTFFSPLIWKLIGNWAGF